MMIFFLFIFQVIFMSQRAAKGTAMLVPVALWIRCPCRLQVRAPGRALDASTLNPTVRPGTGLP
jgi:hypothetical protein